MQQPIDKELLKKYLNDQCTPTELQQVRVYLKDSRTQEILHELITAESEAAWDRATAAPVELDESLKTWQSKFESRKTVPQASTDIQPVQGFFRHNNLLKYAAVFTTLVLGIGIYAANRLKENAAASTAVTAQILKEFSTAKGQRATITLADGTRVYMGAGSRLKYPEQFTDSIRAISLEGEAFFEVAHNAQKPFIIQTHNIRTQVLGTSFKVNAIEGRPFGVQVATGKVRVDRINSGHTEHLAVLTPGQQVTLNTLNGKAVSDQVTIQDIKEWKSSVLVFRDQTIGDIAKQLERAYNVRFNFENAAKAREVVTVTLRDNVPLNQTLRVLSAGTQFRYKINDNEITIK